MKVGQLGSGKVRSYSLSDAIHLAIIAGLAKMGLSITGSGETLSTGLHMYACMHLREHGHLDNFAPVALTPDGDDWLTQPNFDTVHPERQYVVMRMRGIVREVFQRINLQRSQSAKAMEKARPHRRAFCHLSRYF
ncbi:hypothetical protein J2X36_002909 [Methylobacterium sp. BE186]|nr:hypothetical protein [Methylobacterium sp. BE186]